MLRCMLWALAAAVQPKALLIADNLCLRQQLVVLQRRRFRFEEVPCKMRPRTTGRSSITAAKSLYYIAHVLLGVFVNVLKYDGRPRPAAPKPGPGG